MFTTGQREELRAALVSRAGADPRIDAAALTGSAAGGREDRWSDIDLALRLAVDADRDGVAGDWTAWMYREHRAVAHLDVWNRGTLFRVFLLDHTLQVDIAFWAAAEFGATGPDFRLLFGTANAIRRTAPPDAATLVGWGWLYALHARSSIARSRPWQAEYMISGMRDQALALACLRRDLPAVQGRGVDDLPRAVAGTVTAALVRSLDPDELVRAFGAACEALLAETAAIAADLADRLRTPLRELVATARPAPGGLS